MILFSKTPSYVAKIMNRIVVTSSGKNTNYFTEVVARWRQLAAKLSLVG